MAAFVALNDIFLVTTIGSIFGQRTMTTFKYRVESLSSFVLTPQDVYIELDNEINSVTGLNATLKGCAPSNWSHIETWFQRVSPQRVVKYVSVVGAGPGIQGVATTTNLQASITRRGELATRSAIGGIRVPIAAVNAANGLVTSGLKTQLDALATSMGNALTLPFTGVLVPVIWTPAKPPEKPIATLHDVYSTNAEETVRGLQRRVVGRGI